MRLDYFAFTAAALSAVIGMCLGIFMGIAKDFTLSPVHAHLNLLGWVTLSLYGLYHRGSGREARALDRLQVGTGAAGVALFTIGLGFLLGAQAEAFLPLTIFGSLLCLASMVLFLAILIGDSRRASAGPRMLHDGAAYRA